MEGWKFVELSFSDLICGISYSILLAISLNWIRRISLDFIYILATSSSALYMISNLPILLQTINSQNQIFILKTASSFFTIVSTDLSTVALVGIISELLPNGLETAGITLLLSFGKLAVIANKQISNFEIGIFKVEPGYYSRILYPALGSCLASITLTLISPSMLRY